MNLTANQLAALRVAFGGAVLRISARLGESTTKIETLLDLVAQFLADERGGLVAPFAICINFASSGVKSLTHSTVVANCTNGLVRFEVDSELRLLGATKDSLDEISVAQRSEEASAMEILVDPATVSKVFVCGVPVAQISSDDVGAKHAALGWLRPMSDFAAILRDHVAAAVVNEKQFKYWAKRKTRVLREETEAIFHQGLFWWLDNYVSDALAVYGEASGLGQDKTDITVVTLVGLIVVEVKWLGANAKQTTYSNPPRINEGLEQVKIYIQNDSHVVRGYLVVYDGRPRDVHDTGCNYDPKFRHAQCEEPCVVFLESETPSVAASTNVATTAPSSSPAARMAAKKVGRGGRKAGG